MNNSLPQNEQLPVVIIACKVMQSMLENLLPPSLAHKVTYMDYGLHRTPHKMTWTLQDEIDAVSTPSLIVLGYGLCGNGLNGLQARNHTLLVLRTDDCVAILLGSREAYFHEFEKEPGTYYLSKGWLESGSNPLQEYREYEQKYGVEDAQWIMDTQYAAYSRLVLVMQSEEDMAKYRAQALEVAAYCRRWDMRYEEILGSSAYVRQLIEVVMDLEKADGNFVIVPPGGEIRQDQFI
jgi:hypothetical protein